MVFVTLLDAHRQWFKAKPKDAEITETSRKDPFCNYTIMHEEVFVVPDAKADRTSARNRYVDGEPYIRFYAGVPLTIRRGVHLGSLCVVDTQPREFSLDQTRLLKGLSRLVVDELWLHHLDSTGQAAIETLSAEAKERHLDFESTLLPSRDQIRAACGLLNWSIRELSEASNASVASLKQTEGQGGNLSSPRERGGHRSHVQSAGCPIQLLCRWNRGRFPIGLGTPQLASIDAKAYQPAVAR